MGKALVNYIKYAFNSKAHENDEHKDESTGKTTYEGLMKELRHRYITILKSVYWNSFTNGSMH